MKTAFAAFLAALTLAAAAGAAEPIGGSFLSTVDTVANKTLITGSTNANGLYLRTIATGCAMNLTVSVVPPGTGTPARPIIACSPSSSTITGSAMLPDPLYVPAGWSVTLNTSAGYLYSLYMTYDLVGQ
ncbi:hypothetical protein ACHMW5_23235 [Azospirillum melinis]|uniref:hypothetical protein n=1 Tax=Azospirillum melinis TaxID=328839 RepID=UPI0037573C88